MKTYFQFFINFIFPIAVLVIGMFGNLLGLIVLARKHLKQIGPRHVYIYLFISDTCYIVQIIITFLYYAFNIHLSILSVMSCKVFIYFNYAFDAISPWLLVYISVEKLISIGYPHKRHLLRNYFTQFIYFAFILVSTCIYYLGIPFWYDIMSHIDSSSNQTYLDCDFIDFNAQQWSSYMDLVDRAVTPFILMIISTTLLVCLIFKTRNRINHTVNETKRRKQDLRFAFSSFSMNLLFILLNLPLSVVLFIPGYFTDDSFIFTFYIYYFSYGVNFYVIFFTNSIFRDETIDLFSRTHINQTMVRRNQTQSNTNRTTKK